MCNIENLNKRSVFLALYNRADHKSSMYYLVWSQVIIVLLIIGYFYTYQYGISGSDLLILYSTFFKPETL